MKKISLYLLMILATGMFTSCGDDEPEITRVQDGNGKVFLETGTLVDANLNFSEAVSTMTIKQYQTGMKSKVCPLSCILMEPLNWNPFQAKQAQAITLLGINTSMLLANLKPGLTPTTQ